MKTKNISEFKKGDIITRVQDAIYSNGRTDGSYKHSQFEYVGSNDSIIVLIELEQYKPLGGGSIKTLTADMWSSGWDYFPADQIREAQKRIWAIADALLFDSNLDEELSKSKYEKGDLVKTSDGRLGFVKAVDWHAKKFIGRSDYQIQFPTGVGIFREDEIEKANCPLKS